MYTGGEIILAHRSQVDAYLQLERTGVHVPGLWKERYPHMFSRPSNFSSTNELLTHEIQLTEPSFLREVILAARSHSALHFARSHPSAIESWLCASSRILRTQDVISVPAIPDAGVQRSLDATLNGDVVHHLYQILAAEPVSQGIAREGFTRFIVVSINSRSDHLSSCDENVPSSPLLTGSDLESEVGSMDGIEIGEAFLARSLSPPVSHGFVDAANGISSASSSLSSNRSTDVDNGNATSTLVFGVQTLPKLITPSSHRKGNDSESFLYLKSAELGRIGVFSGDWVCLIVCRFECI